MGDLGFVQRLVSYEVDPNDGPYFMERPFQTAIMDGKLEIARYLLCRCNITDLGSLRAPLYMALRRGSLEDVQAILNGPRTLTADDVNGPSATMMQGLRENLKVEHESFLAASLNLNASPGLKILGDQLKDRRTLWKMGITAMRRLRKDRAPSDFRQVISLLLVSSSMRKTTSIEEFGDYDAFLMDLRRWRFLAVEESRRGVFDELVLSLWGQEMQPLNGQVEDFGNDMDFFRAFARQFAEIAQSPPATHNTAVYETTGTDQNGTNPASDGASELPEPEAQTSDKGPVPAPELQEESRSCTVAAYLRLGAIFCFFMAGLLGRFSSLIDAFYVAPMQLETPSWISFPSFVEEARSKIQDGRIRTVAELDNFMYHKALSSMPLNEAWDQSLMRKVIETGSVFLRSALKHWTMQKSLTYMAVYHGLQPTLLSLSGCIKSNPTSSISADLRLLSNSMREVVHYPCGGISTPISMQTPGTSKSPNVTPGGSGELAQTVSPAHANTDGDVSSWSPQAWSPVASRPIPRPKPSQHLRPSSITQPRKHNNKVQKPPGAEDRRTCPKCGKVLATVTNKNRHVIDKHPESPGQERAAAGSPAGATVPIFHFCRLQCGARYAQARNRNDHEKKACKRRSGTYDAGQG
ncbi:hypothetical protein ACEPPN_019209 [Leptodophora sp. 'Broadleaf-Isolate-01']